MSKKRKNNDDDDMEIAGGPKIRHRFKFDKQDKPIIDQASMDAGEFLPNARDLSRAISSASAEEEEAEKARAAAVEEQAMALVLRSAGAASELKKDTCLLAPEMKSIYTDNLNVERGISNEREKAYDEYMNRDMIYKLLTYNKEPAATALLNKYVAIAARCLRADGVYQAPIGGLTETDLQIGEDCYQFILRSHHKHYKRFFIVQALALSASFVAEFCPREAAHERAFLTDPDALTYFLMDAESPYHELCSRTVTHQFSIGIFVAAVTREWMILRPWETLHRWAAVDPEQPSAQTRLALPAARAEPGYIDLHEDNDNE